MNSAVLIIDERLAALTLLGANLASAGYRVARAADLVQARAHAVRLRPDIVLLSRKLQGVSTLHYVRQLRADERTAGAAIVVIGASATHQPDAVAALESGADDYLAEPFEVNDLFARIKAVVRRRAPHLDDDVVEVEGLRFDPAAHRVSAHGQVLALGAIEYRLLHFFMTHPDRVIGRPRLLDEVWGEQASVEERAVDIHVRRLRLALQAVGHGARMETLRGYGYRFLSRLDDGAITRIDGILVDPAGLGWQAATRRGVAPAPRPVHVERAGPGRAARHDGDASC
ncbi:MAG: hypothetical protein RLZZ584_1522 [Pseudomonadota bacterium]